MHAHNHVFMGAHYQRAGLEKRRYSKATYERNRHPKTEKNYGLVQRGELS